jgi:hypothetical protein
MFDIGTLARRISAEFSSAAEKDRKSRFLQQLNCVGHKAQPEFACKELSRRWNP